MKKATIFMLAPIVWILFWEVLRFIFWEQFTYWPSTLSTIDYMLNHLERLLFHSWTTLKEMLLSIQIAFLIALPLAWIMVLNKSLALFFQSYFVFFQCIPMATLAPIMVTIFGWSQMAILIPTVIMIVFPLTINIYQGFVTVPDKMVNYFRFHGASRFQELVKLRIPHARKQIFAGLRIAGAIAGIGAVAGEGAGAQSGIGIFIQECRRNFDVPGIFSGVSLLIIMSLILYNVIVFVERKTDVQR